MKLLAKAILAIATIFVPQMTTAQSIPDGTFVLGMTEVEGETGLFVEGSLLFGVSSNLSVQGDYYYSDSSDFRGKVKAAGAHLIYDLGQNTHLGIFGGVEDWYGELYDFYGVEARFDLGSFVVEAFGARETYRAYNSIEYYHGLIVSYELGASSSSFFSNGSVNFGVISFADVPSPVVGFTKQLASGMAVNANAIFLYGWENVFQISLSKNLGNGRLFNQRNFSSIFGSW